MGGFELQLDNPGGALALLCWLLVEDRFNKRFVGELKSGSTLFSFEIQN